MSALGPGGDGGSLLRASVDDDRLARATWSRLAEPGDVQAGRLVQRWGAGPALERVARGSDREPRGLPGPAVELDPRPTLDLLRRLGGRLVCPG